MNRKLREILPLFLVVFCSYVYSLWSMDTAEPLFASDPSFEVWNAVCENDLLMFTELLDRADQKDIKIDLNTSFNNKTTLDCAIDNKNEPLAKLLIEKGATKTSAYTYEDFKRVFPDISVEISKLQQAPALVETQQTFATALKVLQLDADLTKEFWMAAKRCDFETMKDLEKNPCTGLNFQQESGGIVWTALDWVIEHNNRSMVSEWAEKGASSFKCYGQEFKSHFEEIEQKYKGRESCCFWNAANTANFQEMKDRFESTKGAIDVNWIKSKNTVLMTSLDCAYEQNDEAMAKYLLEKGAKLCSTTPEQFYFSFPALRN